MVDVTGGWSPDATDGRAGGAVNAGQVSVDAPLAAADLLGHAALSVSGQRGSDGYPDAPLVGVGCGRPLLYPVPRADLPAPLRWRADSVDSRYVGALFAFDLDAPPDGGRFVMARFEVSLDDPRAVAVQVHADGGALGVVCGAGEPEPASAMATRTVAATRTRPGWLRRLASRSGTPRAWVTGTQSAHFGWVFEHPHGDELPRTYATHALLEVPAGVATLCGTLTARVALRPRGTRTGRHLAHLARPVPFAEPLGAGPVPTGAAVRLCMAADISGYSRRTSSEAVWAQEKLVSILAGARRSAGIAESAVTPQPQGDGQFTVLPVGIDEAAVIPRLVGAVATALRALNAGRQAEERVRLRLALHRGLVREASNGWVGAAAVAVHRILDSPPLRSALREHPGVDLALGLPDVLYQDVIVPGVDPPLPGRFTAMTVDLPEKGFVERGWLMLGPEWTP